MVALSLAQCTKDTDCKGDRVCVDGACRESLVPSLSFAESERRARIDELTRELEGLRGEQLRSPFGPLAVIIGGALFGGLSGMLGYLFASTQDPTYGYFCLASGVAGLSMLLGGSARLSLNLTQRRLLPAQIADREAGLRGLGVESP